MMNKEIRKWVGRWNGGH